MNRLLPRLAMAGATTAAALSLTALPAQAGLTTPAVSGTATCGTAGPVGRYTLNWTVNNVTGSTLTVNSATESGAFTGTVTINPGTIQPGGSGTGSDGPVGGTTTGTVTLTVDYSLSNETTGTAVGTITLQGNCVIPTTTSSVAPTSISTTTTAKPTTTTAAAAKVTPRFTG